MAIQIKRYNNGTLSETLKALNSSEYTLSPDDRVELVQTINGVTITDGGRYTAGDRITLNADVDNTTFNKLKTVWSTREIVDVVFEDGTTLTNAVVLIRQIAYSDKLLPRYKKLQLEIWHGNNLVSA